MPKFRACPNCREVPGGFPDGVFMKIYECNDCGRQFCYRCADNGRCPGCNSKSRRTIGKVYADSSF